MASSLGVSIVELDLRIPFTAARARNEGFRHLRELFPDISYVQFVDGDCEIVGGWVEEAIRFLDARPGIAAVCGRLRERNPELSIYNMLCDMEWDTPIGETRACGGIALMRVAPFEAVGGFLEELIAGEEPELCFRLRAADWRVWRLDRDMALHDAAMTRFGQWWKRRLRGGFAFAQGARLHGASPERYRVREFRSTWVWGLCLPICTIAGTALAGPIALVVLLLYPLQVVRLAMRGNRTMRENWWRAVFLVIGKFPEVIGQAKFLIEQALGKRARLIEYK